MAVSVGSPYRPDFPYLSREWGQSDADHFAAAYIARDKPELMMRAGRDGTLTLFSRRVGDRLPRGHVAVFESAIAGLVKRALAFAGRLYRDAGYTGSVDAALVVRPLTGAFGMVRLGREDFERPYPTVEYRRGGRFLTAQLDSDREAARASSSST